MKNANVKSLTYQENIQKKKWKDQSVVCIETKESKVWKEKYMKFGSTSSGGDDTDN